MFLFFLIIGIFFNIILKRRALNSGHLWRHVIGSGIHCFAWEGPFVCLVSISF